MRVLALDTTTRAGSVALIDDDRLIAERAGDGARTHAERLPREILELLAEHDIALGSIDLFGVASGPGSFTGLRIGIATIQGLAFVTGRRVAAVSALEALAQTASGSLEPGALVAAWMDAHRREVFSAVPFQRDRLFEIDPPAVAGPRATLMRWDVHVRNQPVVFIGDGAVLYEEMVTDRCSDGPEDRPPAAVKSGTITGRRRVLDMPLLAAAIGRMAVASAQHGDTADPAGVRPLYVRRPDAELDRERRTAQALE
jgi:tRNA threonylcarbamoyladenosine biosynthesis protein TsaB